MFGQHPPLQQDCSENKNDHHHPLLLNPHAILISTLSSYDYEEIVKHISCLPTLLDTDGIPILTDGTHLFLSILRHFYLSTKEKIDLIEILKEREDYGCHMGQLLQSGTLEILLDDLFFHPLLMSVYVNHAMEDIRQEENLWKRLISSNFHNGIILFEMLYDEKDKHLQFIACWMSCLKTTSAIRATYQYIMAKLYKHHHEHIKKIADFQILLIKLEEYKKKASEKREENPLEDYKKKQIENQNEDMFFLRLSRRYNFFSCSKTPQEILYEKFQQNVNFNALRALKALQHTIETEIAYNLKKSGSTSYFQFRR